MKLVRWYKDHVASSPWRTMLVLLCLSLGIRLALWALLVSFPAQPPFDEESYLRGGAKMQRAVEEIAACVMGGEPPSAETLDSAYGSGWRPPLFLLLMGLCFASFGTNVAVARLLNVVLSALTTPLVYAVSARLASRRGATLAALLHVFDPAFIAFSHLVMMEATYMLMCMVMLYCGVRAFQARQGSRKRLFAFLAGGALGLAALTRAVALPYVLVVPFYLGVTARRWKLRALLPVLCLLGCAVVVLPWELTLMNREGRFVPLTVGSADYLFWDNNPVGPGMQSKWYRALAIQQYADEQSVGWTEATRSLALKYIREEWRQFTWKCFGRFAALCRPCEYHLRCVVSGVYPPMPEAVVVTMHLAGIVFFLGTVGLAWIGLVYPGEDRLSRGFIVLLVAAAVPAPVIVYATPRYALPLLCMALPAAGRGVGLLRKDVLRKNRWRTAATVLLLMAFFASTMRGRRVVADGGSHYYAGGRWTSVWKGGYRWGARDCILLRASRDVLDDSLRIELADTACAIDEVGWGAPEWWCHVADSKHCLSAPDSEGRRHLWAGFKDGALLWTPGRDGGQVGMTLRSVSPSGRPQLRVSNETTHQSVSLSPVNRAAWRRWQPAGLDGVEYVWMGGWPVRPPEDDDWWKDAEGTPTGPSQRSRALRALFGATGPLVNVPRSATKMTPLHWAAQKGEKELAETLLERGAALDAGMARGETPLHVATMNGHAGVAEVLLQHGADPNAVMEEDRTALHLAARDGYTEVAAVLLAGGADVNARMRDGKMPLHMAAVAGRKETVELLLKAGADATARTYRGDTPRDLALRGGYADVAELLQAYEFQASENSEEGGGEDDAPAPVEP